MSDGSSRGSGDATAGAGGWDAGGAESCVAPEVAAIDTRGPGSEATARETVDGAEGARQTAATASPTATAAPIASWIHVAFVKIVPLGL